MTIGANRDREQDTIAAQAADWFVANREPLDAEQKAAFGEWLRRSPRHEQEYLTLLRLARRLQHASGRPPSVEALLEAVRSEEAGSAPPIGARRRAAPAAFLPRPWLYAAAAAGLACVAVLMFWGRAERHPPQTAQVPSQHYLTGHGQQLTQSLADGSLLRLDTDSAVTVRYERGLRQVEIERGQAVFTVAHDPARPFRVTAGSAQVVAVGTQFDVYLQGDVTLVTVVEGRVSVGPSGAGDQPATVSTNSVDVSAAQQVRVVRGLVSAPSQVDIHRVMAWLHRQIAFENEALSAVAGEFSRYSPVPVVIESPEVGTLPVSGVFNVDDTESFVAFLRSLKGVGVEVTPTRIRVFKR
ncbi:MAG TPA: FecR domain-containing protein [Burkholderiales bacterium]|nr:FecR domain-containing protein [Burkholderiales bacterium]